MEISKSRAARAGRIRRSIPSNGVVNRARGRIRHVAAAPVLLDSSTGARPVRSGGSAVAMAWFLQSPLRLAGNIFSGLSNEDFSTG
ncbi:hypothetical protein [Xylophilus sp.]|uniref:hypothetical protein n=1 Tax=Xylophilus sp. TaxID=2653893 RepID=UPI002D80834A|nr:hypothetical protein [Xylophilus sp.]